VTNARRSKEVQGKPRFPASRSPGALRGYAWRKCSFDYPGSGKVVVAAGIMRTIVVPGAEQLAVIVISLFGDERWRGGGLAHANNRVGLLGLITAGLRELVRVTVWPRGGGLVTLTSLKVNTAFPRGCSGSGGQGSFCSKEEVAVLVVPRAGRLRQAGTPAHSTGLSRSRVRGEQAADAPAARAGNRVSHTIFP